MSERTVVVVTMPRSGSSLLAGMIHHLGVPMGSASDLAKGRHLNRFGCYEDQELQRISLNILFEANLLLDLTRRLELDEAALAAAVERHRTDIERFAQHNPAPLWGFKDPGLIYALPHLHHLLHNPVYIHLSRETAATARSLYRTMRPAYWVPEMRAKLPLFTPSNRIRLIARAVRLLVTRPGRYVDAVFFEEVIRCGQDRIEQFLADKPSLPIDLAELIESSEGTIDRIAAFLGIEPTPEQRQQALAFVHPELLHSTDAHQSPPVDRT
jgi:hypothetical protein